MKQKGLKFKMKENFESKYNLNRVIIEIFSKEVNFLI